MARAARTCAEPGCIDITRGRYCEAHDRTTSQRGYDHHHQAARGLWKPHVDRGEVICWRCGQRIIPDHTIPGHGWDLGHDAGEHAGPEHANQCNRRAAGQGDHPHQATPR